MFHKVKLCQVQKKITEEIFSKDLKTEVIADGITNISGYLSSRIKVSIVNKEANEPNGGGYTITSAWKKRLLCSKTQFFSELIAAILEGIISNPTFENRLIHWNSENYAIGNANYINISKCVAGSSSNTEELIEKGKIWSDIVRKQMEIADSDIIYCGGDGVWNSLKQTLSIPAQISDCYDGTNVLIKGVYKVDNKVYINSCHPSYLHFMGEKQEEFFQELARIRDKYY